MSLCVRFQDIAREHLPPPAGPAKLAGRGGAAELPRHLARRAAALFDISLAA